MAARHLTTKVLVTLGIVVACGGQLRRPPRDAHPAVILPTYVDYPPPPAVAEVVALDPQPPCVWLDGHWEWLGRRWDWQPGGWVTPPPDCYYAHPFLNWSSTAGTARLMYIAPHWYPVKQEGLTDEQIRTQCRKPVPCAPPAKPYRAPGAAAP